MSSAEDQPWGWDSPHSGSPWLEVSSEVGRGGAAQCPGQGPGSSEEGPCTFPLTPGPKVTVILQLLSLFIPRLFLGSRSNLVR